MSADDDARQEWLDREGFARYPRASQRCPSCRRTFYTLADEYGQHNCPHCGYDPEPEEERRDDQ